MTNAIEAQIERYAPGFKSVILQRSTVTASKMSAKNANLVGGDISGVTLGLGITFNATLTALSLSILVMFCLHQLQQAQDKLVLDTRNYIDRGLIRHMRVFK